MKLTFHQRMGLQGLQTLNAQFPCCQATGHSERDLQPIYTAAMRSLRKTGLVSRRKEGRRTFWILTEAGRDALCAAGGAQ